MKEKNVTTQKKMVTAVKGIALAVLLVAIVCVVSVGIFTGMLLKASTSGGGPEQIEGTYAIAIASGEDTDSTVLSFVFSAEDMTYRETISLGEKEYDLAAGTYTYDAQSAKVVCTPDSDSDAQTFFVSGDYLFADGYFYEGEIPDGKTFDAVCTYTNSAGTETVITFSADGTYTEVGGTSTATSGTYTRKNDTITRTASDGSPLVDFQIYEGQISNSYYVKK
jgi:hypothetical protein